MSLISHHLQQLESVNPFIGATITVKGQSVILGICLFRQYSLTSVVEALVS